MPFLVTDMYDNMIDRLTWWMQARLLDQCPVVVQCMN